MLLHQLVTGYLPAWSLAIHVRAEKNKRGGWSGLGMRPTRSVLYGPAGPSHSCTTRHFLTCVCATWLCLCSLSCEWGVAQNGQQSNEWHKQEISECGGARCTWRRYTITVFILQVCWLFSVESLWWGGVFFFLKSNTDICVYLLVKGGLLLLFMAILSADTTSVHKWTNINHTDWSSNTPSLSATSRPIFTHRGFRPTCIFNRHQVN